VTFHHNPYSRSGGKYERTDEYRTFIEETLTHSPKAQVIWAHWCGQSTPEDAKKLLTRFPYLTCELAWLHKPLDYVATRLVDENNQFVEGWKKVIEDFQTTLSSAWIHRQNLRTLLTTTNGPEKFAPHSVG